MSCMLRPFIAALVPSLVAYALLDIDRVFLIFYVVVATIVGTLLKRGPLAQALLIFGIIAGVLLALLGIAISGAGRVEVIGGDLTTALLLIVATVAALSFGYAMIYKLLGKWF